MTTLYTSKEARRKLGVSATQLIRLANQGKIRTTKSPYHKREKLYNGEDVDKLVKEIEDFKRNYRIVEGE